jgi:hypothetical protein
MSPSSHTTSTRAREPVGESVFLAEAPLDAAKAAAQSSDDEQLLFEEAKRLVAALTSIAMTGQRRQPGEDEMQISFHSIPVMARDLTARQADAQKDGFAFGCLVQM